MGNNNSYYRKSYIAQEFSQPPYMPSQAKLHRSTSDFRGRPHSTPPLPKSSIHDRRHYLVPENKVMHDNPAFGMNKLKKTGKLDVVKSGGTLRVIQLPSDPDVDERVDELIQKLNHRTRLLVKSEWAMKRSNSVGDLVESTTSRSISDVEIDMLSSQCSVADEFHLGPGNGRESSAPLRKSRKKSRAPEPPTPTTGSSHKEKTLFEDSNNNVQKKAKKKGKKSPAPPPPSFTPSPPHISEEGRYPFTGSLMESQSYQSMISIRTADIEEKEQIKHVQKQEQIAQGVNKRQTLDEIVFRSAERERNTRRDKRSARKSDPLGEFEKGFKERKIAQRSDSILDVLANLRNRKNLRSKSADHRIEADDPNKGFVLRRYTGSQDDITKSEITEIHAQNGKSNKPEEANEINFDDMHMSMTTKLTEKILKHLKQGDYRIKEIKASDNGMMFTIDSSKDKDNVGNNKKADLAPESREQAESEPYDDRLTGFTLQPVLSEHSFNSDRTSEWVRQAVQYGDSSSMKSREAVLDLSSESEWDDHDDVKKDLIYRKSSPGTECSDLLTSSASSFAWNVKPTGYNSKPKLLTSSAHIMSPISKAPQRGTSLNFNHPPHILESKIKQQVRPTLPKKEWEPDYAFDPELAWEKINPGMSTEVKQTQHQDIEESIIEKNLVPVLPRKTQKIIDMLHVSEDDGYTSQHSPTSSDLQQNRNEGKIAGWIPEMDLNGELDEVPVKEEYNSADRGLAKPVLTLQNMFSRPLQRRDYTPIPDRDSPSSDSSPLSPASATSPSSSFINDSRHSSEHRQKNNRNWSGDAENNVSGSSGTSKMNKLYSFKSIQKSVKDALGNRKTKKQDDLSPEYEPSSNWIMRQNTSDLDSDKNDTQEHNLKNIATSSECFLQSIPEFNAKQEFHIESPQSPPSNMPRKFGHSGGHVIYLPPYEFAQLQYKKKDNIPGITLEEEIAEKERQREEERKLQDQTEIKLRHQHENDQLILERHLFKVTKLSEPVKASSATISQQTYENSEVVKPKQAMDKVRQMKEFEKNRRTSNPSSTSMSQINVVKAEKPYTRQEPVYENSAVELAAVYIGDLRRQIAQEQVFEQQCPSPPPPLPNKQKSSQEREGLSRCVQPSHNDTSDVDVVLGTRVQSPQQREKSIEAWIRKQQQSVGLQSSANKDDKTVPVKENVQQQIPAGSRSNSRKDSLKHLLEECRREVKANESVGNAKDQFFFGMEKDQKKVIADSSSSTLVEAQVHHSSSGCKAERKPSSVSSSANHRQENCFSQKVDSAGYSHQRRHNDSALASTSNQAHFRKIPNKADHQYRRYYRQGAERYPDHQTRSADRGLDRVNNRNGCYTPQKEDGPFYDEYVYERFISRSTVPQEKGQGLNHSVDSNLNHYHGNRRIDHWPHPELLPDDYEDDKKLKQRGRQTAQLTLQFIVKCY